jgi:hypothetical protein
VLGEKVISSVDAFNSSPVRIDISEYAAGMYFLKLNGKYLYRVVKQ